MKSWVKNIVLLLSLYIAVILIVEFVTACEPSDFVCELNKPASGFVAIPFTILIAFIWSKVAKKFNL